MKPLLLMKHTLAYLLKEAESKNPTAIEQLAYYDSMDIVDKDKYLVLTDKIVPDETS